MYNGVIKKVHVELSDKCNAECPICPRSHYGGIVHPNIKNIQLSVDYFKLLGPDFIRNVNFWLFCGTRGDPMANTEIVSILEYITSINVTAHFNINTNGSLGSPKQFRRMSEVLGNNRGGHGKIVFSVDGWEDTNHIYRKNVKWEKVMRNMLAYCEGPGKAQWDFLVFEHNKKDIPTVKKFCDEHGIILELKEPAGFDWDNTDKLNTIPVHSKKDGSYLYEIFPDTKSASYDKIKHVAVEARTTNDVKHNQQANRFHNREVIIISDDYKEHPKTARVGYDNMYEDYKWLKDTGDRDISCQAIDTSELFIDCDGTFLPCCYIGGSAFAGDNQLTDMIGDQDLLRPTATWTPKDILNTEYFQKTLPSGMKGELDDSIGHCVKCVQVCGKWPERQAI